MSNYDGDTAQQGNDGGEQTADTLEPGQQEVDGDVFEYPFRVQDYHGETVREGLDTIPPFLNQEEIDILVSELVDRFEDGVGGGHHEQTLIEILRKLPDREYGRDALPAWIVRQSEEADLR